MNLKPRIFRHRHRTPQERRELHHLEALRAIATVEFAKGVIVLLLAFGVLSLVRRGNLWTSSKASSIFSISTLTAVSRSDSSILPIVSAIPDSGCLQHMLEPIARCDSWRRTDCGKRESGRSGWL